VSIIELYGESTMSNHQGDSGFSILDSWGLSLMLDACCLLPAACCLIADC